MNINSFSPDVIRNLKYYVYLLSDPDTGEIFYVGKGKGNRVFDHFKEKKSNDKNKKINTLLGKGTLPKLEILIHGIEDDYTIKKIEASVIDLLNKNNLTNIMSGYESSEFGRMDVNQIQAKYSNEKADISEKVLLIKLSKTFRYNMTPLELYEYTRGIWKVSKKKIDEVEYVFSVYDGIIQETYNVLGWFSGGKSFSIREDIDEWKLQERWEFVGDVDLEMRKKYQYKTVDHYWKNNDQNPIRYTF